MDVLGKPQDEKGPVQGQGVPAIHRPAPAYDEQRRPGPFWSTGIKGDRLLYPLARRQGRLFGGAGVGRR